MAVTPSTEGLVASKSHFYESVRAGFLSGKIMVELWRKGSVSVIVQPKQEETLFSWSQSPGNGGTTGRTVENNPADKRRQRRWGGRVIDTEGKQEWADGHSLDRERSGVVSKSVHLLICIFSLLPPRLDGSKGILSTRSVCNKACFYHWDQGFWVKVWFFQQHQQKYHRETLRREESWKVVYFWFMFSVTE